MLATLLFVLPLFVAPAACSDPIGVDLKILDSKNSPCEDFYQYACGGWLAKTKIPADRPMWNRSFSTIDESNRKLLDRILRDYVAGKQTPRNPYLRLLADFYGSCMNAKVSETQSLPELRQEFVRIDNIADIKALAPLLADLHKEAVNALFSFGQEQDAKDSSQVIGVADQGGLGLPDRDYYLKTDPKTIQIRELYQEHIARMFHLMAGKEAKLADSAPAIVLDIETRLAKASMSLVDRRDPNKVYHRLERKGLIERAPLIDWASYLNVLDKNTTPHLTTIDISVPDFFIGLNNLLKSSSLSDIKTYLKWHLLSSYAEALPKRFVDEQFRFVSTALTGQKRLEPRWKRCVRATNAKLGFAIGRSFIAVAYGEKGKTKSDTMIRDIEDRFHHDLKALPWMDDSTRKEALLKLSRVNNKVGYPKVWRSYQGLKADSKSFFRNLQAATRFDALYQLDKIGKPVNPEEWDMPPATVNAYYDPQRNEMVFPAGILQYPFFSPKSPNTLNYGAIGAVMGHELTHGFDDEGRKYDANGNLRNWWDEKVLAEFDKKTACVVKEYSSFQALPGVFVNGELTQGENIADQGGLKFAYDAWLKRFETQPEIVSTHPTPEQRFFIAYAQSWCQKEQEAYTRMRATIDPHSPSRFRVNGVVSQFPPFAKAFSCQPGSKMAPSSHCEVW